VTILAVEFDQPSGLAQIVFQMHRVVELYRGGIAVQRTCGRKFRMIPVKACDVLGKTRHTVGCVEMGVTLDAIEIARRGQSQAPLMLLMTRRAIWSESLIRVVNRAVMARFAALIARLGTKIAGPLDVTCVALVRKHGVRGRNTPATVDVIVAKYCIPAKPQERDKRSGHTQDEAQAAEWMWALEILQVDALGEFFGCELASGHVDSLLFYLNIARP
jgi:hypothetical protein